MPFFKKSERGTDQISKRRSNLAGSRQIASLRIGVSILFAGSAAEARTSRSAGCSERVCARLP
jgi:hypothetical protein